jgi:hypothetical protein
MRARVSTLTVTAPRAVLLDVQAARQDLMDAGGVVELVTEEGEELAVKVELDDEP